MTRLKLILYSVLAAAGTAALATYAALMAPLAPTNFDVALLLFTGVAAAVGWLGLVVSFLSYRLEATRVPRPDVLFLGSEGALDKHLTLQITIAERQINFDTDIDEKRTELRALAANAKRGSSLFGGVFYQAPTKEDFDKHYDKIEKYLKEYESYLEDQSIWNEFWNRSVRLVIAFTNAKAGVPASGMKVLLRFPEDEGITIMPQDELPEEPQEPPPPTIPRPRDMMASLAGIRVPDYTSLARPLAVDFPRRPGNVSGPDIGKGSILVTYEVNELLHNTVEDTNEEPVILTFSGFGSWSIPYEIHARNLPSPQAGSLTIAAQAR